MCLSDNGNGLRGPDGVNGYPSGIHVGASWNRQLALEKARYLGAEFKAKGANVALGPVIGPRKCQLYEVSTQITLVLTINAFFSWQSGTRRSKLGRLLQ